MNSYKRTRVTNEQRKLLLQLMMDNEDLAKGRLANGNMRRQQMLHCIARRLNAFGPQKSPDKWWKCWQDWRCDTKAKLHRLKLYIRRAAGGPSPVPLTKLEERLLKFCGLEVVQIPENDFEQLKPLSNSTTVSNQRSNEEDANSFKPIKWKSEIRNRHFSDQSDSEDLDLTVGPDSELWGFYEKVDHKWTKCTICEHRIKQNTERLYNHLKEKHSKICQTIDYKEGDENYTEVIYLEDPIDHSIVNCKTPLKPLRKTVESSKDDMEIDNFMNYIAGVLKDVPRNICTKLQTDIVKLISDAKLQDGGADISEVDRGKELNETDITENQENKDVTLTTERQFDTQGADARKSDRQSSIRSNRVTDTKLTENDRKEVENFTKYVTCLMKTITCKNIRVKLKMQIVDLIMTARLQITQNGPIDSSTDRLEVPQDTLVI